MTHYSSIEHVITGFPVQLNAGNSTWWVITDPSTNFRLLLRLCKQDDYRDILFLDPYLLSINEQQEANAILYEKQGIQCSYEPFHSIYGSQPATKHNEIIADLVRVCTNQTTHIAALVSHAEKMNGHLASIEKTFKRQMLETRGMYDVLADIILGYE